MSAEMDREIKRLSNLKNYKGLSSDDLSPIARINVLVREFHKEGMFFDSNDKNTELKDDKERKAQKIAIAEQKSAEDRFREYLTNNEIENASDIDTLKSLIFNEIFEVRIQSELNNLAKEGHLPNDKLIKSLVEVQNQKSSLKIKLGIDRKEEEKDDLTALQLLQKRVHKHIQENKNEFTIYLPWACEKCGYKDIESYLLYKRVKDFKIIKHPWFVGRYLFNYEIIKDVKDNKISKQQATKYLLCAGQGGEYKLPAEDKKWCEDYINYCLENFTEITEMLKKN